MTYSRTVPRAARARVDCSSGLDGVRRQPGRRASPLCRVERPDLGPYELLSRTRPQPASPTTRRCSAACCRRVEPACRVGGETGGRADRRVRRVEIDEIARARSRSASAKRREFNDTPGCPSARDSARRFVRVADPWDGVAAGRHIERAARVEPEQPVVAGPVQVDQHRRERRRVAAGRIARASGSPPAGLNALVAHLIEVRRAALGVRRPRALEAPQSSPRRRRGPCDSSR